MDTGKGIFEPISLEKWNEQMEQPEPMVFKEGEIIILRGSKLRVQKIYKNKITFKLLPKMSEQKGEINNGQKRS